MKTAWDSCRWEKENKEIILEFEKRRVVKKLNDNNSKQTNGHPPTHTFPNFKVDSEVSQSMVLGFSETLGIKN